MQTQTFIDFLSQILLEFFDDFWWQSDHILSLHQIIQLDQIVTTARVQKANAVTKHDFIELLGEFPAWDCLLQHLKDLACVLIVSVIHQESLESPNENWVLYSVVDHNRQHHLTVVIPPLQIHVTQGFACL